MKIFISWSGSTSHKVAIVLRDWLPSVIQSLEPYVSSEDIDKGARWSTDISKELENSSFGILCITKDNLDASWLHFEAGALSKSVERSRVSPFLFGVKRSEIQGPILQFQSTTFERDDVKKLVQSLNLSDSDEAPSLDESRLEQIFDVWWPTLEKGLNEIEVADAEEVAPSSHDPSRSSEIMEEVLELLRGQHRLLNSPEELIPPEYLDRALRRHGGLPDDRVSSRRGGLPADHPIFSDLEQTLLKFEEALSQEDVQIIRESWSHPRSLLRVILERNLSRRRRLLHD